MDCHFQCMYDKCVAKYVTTQTYPVQCDGVIKYDNHSSRMLVIIPTRIDAMMNIKIESSNEYIGEIYNGNTLVACFYDGDVMSDIHRSLNISTYIVFTFLKPPRKLHIMYKATILANVEIPNHRPNPRQISAVPIQALIANGRNIHYYRVRCELLRVVKLKMHDSALKKQIKYVDMCYKCNKSILSNVFPIWYVNTPLTERLLCDECGCEIGESTDDCDIVLHHRFAEWSC